MDLRDLVDSTIDVSLRQSFKLRAQFSLSKVYNAYTSRALMR